MTESKRPRKIQLQDLLTAGPDVIDRLYNRIDRHMPAPVTEQDVFNLLVRDDHKEMCLQARELFNYNGGSFEHLTIRKYENGVRLCVWCRDIRTFVLPSYLAGKLVFRSDVNPRFLELIEPWARQLVQFFLALRETKRAWNSLRMLTQDNVSKMVALWPSVAVISKEYGLPLDALPRASALPSPYPELREQMRIGADFINTAMLMGENTEYVRPAVSLWLADD